MEPNVASQGIEKIPKFMVGETVMFDALAACSLLKVKAAAIGQLPLSEQQTIEVEAAKGWCRFQEKRRIKVISEAGIVMILMQSPIDDARELRLWLAARVLPAITEFGGFFSTELVEEMKAEMKTDPNYLEKFAKIMAQDGGDTMPRKE